LNKRIILNKNGTLFDWSHAIGSYSNGIKEETLTASQDSILIGSRLPFNHFYIKLLEETEQLSSLKVSYWSSGGWRSSVEIMDETGSFSRSGFISFTPDKNADWKMEEESKSIPELASVIIYDHYWVKVESLSNMTNPVSFEWIGNIFSDDSDLGSEFPDLIKNAVLTSFQAGKSDWQEQHVKAAEIIEQDLINRGIVDGNENILDREWYRNAAVQKTAEIIFGAFGDDYTDQRIQARDEYKLRLVKRLARVDKNKNAIEEPFERKVITGFLCR